MTLPTSNPIRKKSPIACKKCGAVEFDRSSSEEGTIVTLYEQSFGVDDEVIHEGDQEFSYQCTECGAEFTG